MNIFQCCMRKNYDNVEEYQNLSKNENTAW